MISIFSRGDLIVKTSELPKEAKQIEAKVCWMDAKNLVPGTKYLIQHGANRVLQNCRHSKSNQNRFLWKDEAYDQTYKSNEIGEFHQIGQTFFYDAYADNKANGSFILIDAQTNNTSGVGFIQ